MQCSNLPALTGGLEALGSIAGAGSFSIIHVWVIQVDDVCFAVVLQAVPELVSSLSRGRLSTALENSGEAADGSSTPGISGAAEGSPWEAKSPGDSPRSRTPLHLDSMAGDRRQARALHVLANHRSLKLPSWLCVHGTLCEAPDMLGMRMQSAYQESLQLRVRKHLQKHLQVQALTDCARFLTRRCSRIASDAKMESLVSVAWDVLGWQRSASSNIAWWAAQVTLAQGSGARRLAEVRCRAAIQLLLVQASGEIYAAHSQRLPQAGAILMLDALADMAQHARDVDADLDMRRLLAAAQVESKVRIVPLMPLRSEPAYVSSSHTRLTRSRPLCKGWVHHVGAGVDEPTLSRLPTTVVAFHPEQGHVRPP